MKVGGVIFVLVLFLKISSSELKIDNFLSNQKIQHNPMADKLKNVILAGSSGMIGKGVLERCIQSPKVNLCTSIVRKKSGIIHPKLLEVVHDDFKDYSKVEEHFKEKDVAFYTIGVYTGAVPEDKFKEITVDYTDSFAKTLKKHSTKTTFCFLSGDGADPTLKSSMLFAREKGKAENILTETNFDNLFIFRPGISISS